MGVGEAIVNQRKKNFSGTVKSRHDAKTEAALFLRQAALVPYDTLPRTGSPRISLALMAFILTEFAIETASSKFPAV